MSDHFKVTTETRKNGVVSILAIEALPPNNTLTLAMLREFVSLMNELAEKSDGILVSSTHPKFFSNGLDGKTLLESPPALRKETVEEMIRAFGRLVQVKKPWVAELNGYTMAGGAVIALAADYRFMLTTAGRIGFSELAIGLPLPVVYLHGMHKVVAPHAVRTLLEGNALKPDEAKAVGLVDDLAETPEELRSKCLKRLDQIFRLEQDSYLPTRALYRSVLLREIERDEPEDLRQAGDLVKLPVFERAMQNIAGKNR
ncbi:MAG: enoyl-CoA hydratase/isomerase family protein [Spirochaetia bacterium]|nr:enoyl-CoA hydratase/isomerase family protein [Spirochaetia bacterium]